MKLTHFDEDGKAKMVDVSEKPVTYRKAEAMGSVYMKSETLKLIRDKKVSKGDALCVARIAGIMAAKKTADIIPMCHPLNVSSVDIEFVFDEKKNRLDIKTSAKTAGQTGVEMEALVAASVAALTIYDMCKSADREMVIGEIMLLKKSGGKSGKFKRKTAIGV